MYCNRHVHRDFLIICILLDYNSNYMFRPNCRAIFRLIFEQVEYSSNYNLIKYKVVSDCILYILYYILAYIQHNGEVSLENKTP